MLHPSEPRRIVNTRSFFPNQPRSIHSQHTIEQLTRPMPSWCLQTRTEQSGVLESASHFVAASFETYASFTSFPHQAEEYTYRRIINRLTRINMKHTKVEER